MVNPGVALASWNFEVWSYRHDQFHRHKLLRAFTDR
jgi:hypothetical protein